MVVLSRAVVVVLSRAVVVVLSRAVVYSCFFMDRVVVGFLSRVVSLSGSL